MNLYSVLMVDDEDEVIRIIRRKIDWEEMGFYVCGQAKNGIEALEMVEELQPDVVMTDIKMPYMDGLELTKQLKTKYPDIRIIIFSGFDEFEYVKQAIGLEVEEYLLKPIDSGEIRKVFEKTRNALNAARDMRNNIAHLENYYERSLPLLRESFFASLMEENIPQKRLDEYLEEYKIELTGPYYAMAIIHTSEHSIPEDVSPRLLRLSVRQYVDSSFMNDDRSYIFNYRRNVVVLTQFDKPEDVAKYTDMCDRFCKSVKRATKAVVSIGIGKCVKDISDISQSYKGAREALSYRTLYGSGNAINIVEIDSGDSKSDMPEVQNLHEIFKMIKMGSVEDTKQAVDCYVDSLIKANMSMSEFGLVMMELISSCSRFLRSNEIEVDKFRGMDGNVYSELIQMGSMERIREWLTESALSIYEEFRKQRVSKTGSFVRKATDYIEENYSDPELSIDVICQELGVSSAYFATVFKRETGKTFVNYLTEVRMKEAERLLVEKNEKNYIIAEKVGYSDPGYFSYVFKKHFGVSPVKYKKQG